MFSFFSTKKLLGNSDVFLFGKILILSRSQAVFRKNRSTLSSEEPKNKMFKSEYVFVLEDVCEDEFICNKKGVIKGLADSISKSITGQRDTAMNELVEYNKNLWQKMCGWYHKTFSRYDGPGGSNNPQKVECPTTDTLLEGKYDLAGCEVIE